MNNQEQPNQGFISGESNVKTTSGIKTISELKKGDVIINYDNTESIVECLVKLTICSFMNCVIIDSDCYVTPIQPITTNKHKHWHYASVYNCLDTIFVSDLYGIVLTPTSNQYISIVCDDQVNVFGLGHNICNNMITYHDYFARKIRDDLKNIDGYDTGNIKLDITDFKFCWQTDDIIGLQLG